MGNKVDSLSDKINEADIVNNWVYHDRVYISCICITYNHQEVIRKTLDSFLSQLTTHRFEILVHDDASTDETTEILLEYKNKYPSIIKLIIQSENQYSKGRRILPRIVKQAEGDYIAPCDGDDYWIDNYKIQKQFDLMQREPEVNGCFHPAYSENPLKERQVIAQHSLESKIFSADEVITGDGGFCPTASLFIKKEGLELMDETVISTIPCGDYFIQILASMKGGLAYLPEPMSIYRIDQNNSFSSNFVKVDWIKKAQFYQQMCNSLQLIDTLTLGKHHIAIQKMVRRHHRSYKNHMKRALKESIKNFFFRK